MMKKQDAHFLQREEKIQQLKETFQHHVQILGNLQEGIKFYTGLLTIIHQLQEKVTEFLSSRNNEKRLLLEKIQKKAVMSGELKQSFGMMPNMPPPGTWNPQMPIAYQGYFPEQTKKYTPK
jgi:hypothetical protein